MKDGYLLAEIIRRAATPEEFASIIGDALRDRDLEIERLTKPLHSDPKYNERCDGRCAKDECVCPEGGWAEEADRIRLEYQLLLTASKQCAGSPKHFGGCGCLCHGDTGKK